MPVAETFPAFAQVAADALGHLWVREYDLPGEERANPLWTVFDPDGRVLGLVETPPGLRVHEIGEDHILGRATDSLGVEYVQMWRLHRAGPADRVPEAPRTGSPPSPCAQARQGLVLDGSPSFPQVGPPWPRALRPRPRGAEHQPRKEIRR